MLYEVTGTPIVNVGSGSQRVALPTLPAHRGAIRLTVDQTAFFAFGDSMVVADDDADSAALFGASVEFIVPLAGATHIAVWAGSSFRMTVTPVRIVG